MKGKEFVTRNAGFLLIREEKIERGGKATQSHRGIRHKFIDGKG